MTVLLENKNCIIYGAGGALGGAIARTFAREGANLFLCGRRREPLDALAAELPGAEIAALDALDGAAVDEHARGVAERAGSVDVSFNLAARGDVQGIPLVDMTADDFLRPAENGLRATFNTATAAARIMAGQGGGAILSLTSGSARGAHPGMGGTGPADAAVETFLRYLAAETGRQGVRVLGIYTAAVKGTLTKESIRETNAGGPDPDEVDRMLSAMAMLGRTPRTDDVAETAAFLASDRASGITANIVNVTCGLFATP
jgi:NAD(P)-dependent dehydrogenase (short-subunit alcohol dehydrogenase family)